MKPETRLRPFFVLLTLTIIVLYSCLFLIVGTVVVAALAHAATGDAANAPVPVIALITMAGTFVASRRTQPWIQRRYETALEWARQDEAAEGSDR